MRNFFLSLLLFTSCQLHAADGAALYRTQCAVCHGMDGSGGVGVPLSLATFQAQSSDEYLIQTIRRGRPGRIMPAFPQFSASEVLSLIKHIRSWQPDIKPAQYPTTAITGDKVRGEKLYQQHCSQCHGVNAEGGHGTGVMFSRSHTLPIMPPALNNSGFMASASDAMLHRIISQGRDKTPMPAAKVSGIKSDQINHIIVYLRSLQPRPLLTANNEPAILEVTSPYSYEETINKVKAAAVGMNFRLIRDQALDSGLVPAGDESKRQMIIYFCNFEFLYDALAIDPRVGLFLPCRVTVVASKTGVVKIMSINPKHLSQMFNNSELDAACESMHKLYQSILEEAIL